MSVVPNRKQAATEVTYGLVRDGVGRDIIGSKEFLKFVPLLFTLFCLIIVNNVFSIVPVIQFPTMSRDRLPGGAGDLRLRGLPLDRHPQARLLRLLEVAGAVRVCRSR